MNVDISKNCCFSFQKFFKTVIICVEENFRCIKSKNIILKAILSKCRKEAFYKRNKRISNQRVIQKKKKKNILNNFF